MKRANLILNVIMASFVGTLIGYGAYVVWDFNAHPGLYAMQSAPWYTSILAYGAVTLVILLLCAALKAIIRYKRKQTERATGDNGL